MKYEKPEILTIGDAEVLIQGSIKPTNADHNGTGVLMSTDVDD